MPDPHHIPPGEQNEGEIAFDQGRRNAPAVVPGTHEYWHFDALSDDGSEALIVRFHSNYPFSSRFFKQLGSDTPPTEQAGQFPAICFTYWSQGSVVLHTVNEFGGEDFSSSPVADEHTIGDSTFRIDAAEYGSGYVLKIDLTTSLKRRIKAECEWLAIETEPFSHLQTPDAESEQWDLTAPRADVSGRIRLIGRRGEVRKLLHFRGTGYHDHIRSSSIVDGIGGPRCWGRAHFADSTIVFQQLAGGKGDSSGDLFLIRDGSAHRMTTRCEIRGLTRDRSGLLIPRTLMLAVDGENISVRVRPLRAVNSGFFEVQMLSEIALELNDGKHRTALALTEFTDPRRMKNPFFRWVTHLRTGKNGRSPLF